MQLLRHSVSLQQGPTFLPQLHHACCSSKAAAASYDTEGTSNGTHKVVAYVHAQYVPLAHRRQPCVLQYYLDNDPKLKKFVPIIYDSVVYPVILDANRTVCSMPPIINGAHSAVNSYSQQHAPWCKTVPLACSVRSIVWCVVPALSRA